MAFNKTKLISDLKQIFSNPNTTNNVDTVAEQMATAIDNYVKSGKATGTDSHGDTHNLRLE